MFNMLARKTQFMNYDKLTEEQRRIRNDSINLLDKMHYHKENVTAAIIDMIANDLGSCYSERVKQIKYMISNYRENELRLLLNDNSDILETVKLLINIERDYDKALKYSNPIVIDRHLANIEKD